jgi:hypothetical protein
MSRTSQSFEELAMHSRSLRAPPNRRQAITSCRNRGEI